MFSRNAYVPLSRRIVIQSILLGAGSAGSLAAALCLAPTLFGASADGPPVSALSTAGSLANLPSISPVMILVPVAMLAVGVLQIRRAADPLGRIERQLGELESDGTLSAASIGRIDGPGPVASGWNRLVSLCTDQPASGRLEDKLAQALAGLRQQKSDRVLNGLTEGVAVTDHQGRITVANQALLALVNRIDDDVTGLAMSDLLPIEDSRKPEFERMQRTHVSRPLVAELQRTSVMADGVLRVARTPLPGEDGQAHEHVWSVRDVTQQKLAEEMRTQFVYSATHELRTPLTNIKAYAETLALADELDVEQQKEFCNTINSEATRLARFVDDLLNISRMEAGSLSLERQETDLERLLHETIEKVRPQMQQKQIDFDAILPPKLPKLTLDKDKFTASLVNLLGNAAKYTPDGGRVVLRVEEGTTELQFHVEDTGYGISEEDLPKLFSKFFRSGDPRVQQITGTGLGLSFVQETIRLHGGKLSVKSELNRGTRFTVSLPRE